MTLDASAPAPAPPSIGRVRRTVTYAGRLLLIGSLLWLGWTTLEAWSLLLHGERGAVPAGAAADFLDNAPVQLLAALPAGSQWALPLPSPGPSLLPLPPTARRLCEQRDREGALRGEIVSVPAAWSVLMALWQDAGWVVTNLGHHLPGDARALCRRDGQGVQVWAGPPDGGTGACIVFLVRQPVER